jgi:hypothetical protein
MLVPRQQYSRKLKIAAMREVESGKGSRKWPACFRSVPNGWRPGKASGGRKVSWHSPARAAAQSKLDADRIAQLERCGALLRLDGRGRPSLHKSRFRTQTREWLPPFSLWRPLRFFFEHGELNFLFDRVDAIHEHAYFLAQAVDLAVALADDLASVFVVGVTVVD